MTDRLVLVTGAAALVAVAAVLWSVFLRPDPPALALGRAYADPAPPPPEGGMRVFHLGHSLVGRDMPAMLAQLAGDGHRFDSQLGWGASLRQHWEPDEEIPGFAAENDHPRFRPAREAVATGDYDAVVLTEMVEIRDAIKYHQSGRYLARWAALAREANPATRVYLYETWHRLDDAQGWLVRLDRDLGRYWKAELLAADIAANAPGHPVYLIPGGQVMARLVRAIEAEGGSGALRSRDDLFQRRDDGTTDPIHPNDLGAYLVALTHYAVLYQRSPEGLPYRLRRADGSAAEAPPEDVARLMQRVVWEVVTSLPETGVAR